MESGAGERSAEVERSRGMWRGWYGLCKGGEGSFNGQTFLLARGLQYVKAEQYLK